jgi:chromosome segregation and condensation protein ScpB
MSNVAGKHPRPFDALQLRDLKLVEEFAGADGRLRFATTEAFLQRFGLASLGELTAASLASNQTATEPLI